MSLVNGEANRRAARRMEDARGSVFDAFDGMACGFDHEDAMDFLMGAPSFQSIPENRRGIVAGMFLGFAMVAVESDRLQR